MSKIREFFSGFKQGQKYFGETISIIINSILLFFVYFIGVGIPSILAKIFRKKFLDIKVKNEQTYWKPLNLSKKPKEAYYRQF